MGGENIDSRDLDFLYEKVCALHISGKYVDCLQEVTADKESYYKDWDSSYGGIMEYSIPNVTALRNKLEELWIDDCMKELIPNVLAATFKMRNKVMEKSDYQDELPQYIYNF